MILAGRHRIRVDCQNGITQSFARDIGAFRRNNNDRMFKLTLGLVVGQQKQLDTTSQGRRIVTTLSIDDALAARWVFMIHGLEKDSPHVAWVLPTSDRLRSRLTLRAPLLINALEYPRIIKENIAWVRRSRRNERRRAVPPLESATRRWIRGIFILHKSRRRGASTTTVIWVRCEMCYKQHRRSSCELAATHGRSAPIPAFSHEGVALPHPSDDLLG